MTAGQGMGILEKAQTTRMEQPGSQTKKKRRQEHAVNNGEAQQKKRSRASGLCNVGGPRRYHRGSRYEVVGPSFMEPHKISRKKQLLYTGVGFRTTARTSGKTKVWNCQTLV